MYLVKSAITRESSSWRRNEQVWIFFLWSFCVGAGSAFPSIVAVIPMGDNADSCLLLNQIIQLSAEGDVRYSSLGNVFDWFITFNSQ